MNPNQMMSMKTIQLSPMGKMDFSLTRNKFNQKHNSYPYLGTAVPTNKLTITAYQQRRPRKVAALHSSTTTEAEQL